MFNDKGEEEENDLRLIAQAENSSFGGDAIATDKLAKGNEDYLHHVKERLSTTKELDRDEKRNMCARNTRNKS